MLYNVFLSLHNVWRWAVVLAGVYVLVLAVIGLVGKKEWGKADSRAGMLFAISMDIQVLVGLILYLFLSPTTKAAFADFGGAMSNTLQRYFAVEHILLMIIALALVHMGSAFVKKAQSSAAKFRRALLWYGLAFVAIMAMIPWPFMQVARPWLRLLGLTI